MGNKNVTLYEEKRKSSMLFNAMSVTGQFADGAIKGVGLLGGKALKTLDQQLHQQVKDGVDHLKAKLAFYPPPPTYILETEAGGALQMWLLHPESRVKASLVAAPGFSVFRLQTATGSRVPAYIFEVQKARFTILCSHSNATDIGHMCELYRRLATVLRVNVMAYEYTGYGCCGAQVPTETETYTDIGAAYAYLVYTKATPPSRIILYGQSIGSGPTIDLAARLGYADLAGVIIHSGITSGMRVIQPQMEKTSWFDIFPNIDKISSILCPVLCIHGVEDIEAPKTQVNPTFP